VSTTAPQALLLLNDEVVLTRARALARRVQREAGPDGDRMIDCAYRQALGRLPDEGEYALLRSFFERADRSTTVEDLCHALFNLNEFLYVD
jgi:hypothetical protein